MQNESDHGFDHELMCKRESEILQNLSARDWDAIKRVLNLLIKSDSIWLANSIRYCASATSAALEKKYEVPRTSFGCKLRNKTYFFYEQYHPSHQTNKVEKSVARFLPQFVKDCLREFYLLRHPGK